MDLIDQLNQIAARIPNQMEHLETEEATKNALVLPVINALGYNVFDPTEVIPEFTADVGTKKGEKADYVIVRGGKPSILFECKTAGATLCLKHANQLFRYFTATDARFAILTNGIEYQFYTDIEKPNTMDQRPFFEFSMLRLDARAVEEVKKFSKTQFDLDNILSTARDLKYRRQIQAILASEMESPTEEFVKFFAKQVYSGSVTASVREEFTTLVKEACRDLIRQQVNQRLQTALEGGTSTTEQAQDAQGSSEKEPKDDVKTTDEEREGYHIVRAILAKHIDPQRIAMRDTKSYCGVLLDDNNRKPICRLRFNHSQKYIGLFDAAKNEDKHPLTTPTDIVKFENELVAIVGFYDPKEDPKATEVVEQ